MGTQSARRAADESEKLARIAQAMAEASLVPRQPIPARDQFLVLAELMPALRVAAHQSVGGFVAVARVITQREAQERKLGADTCGNRLERKRILPTVGRAMRVHPAPGVDVEPPASADQSDAWGASWAQKLSIDWDFRNLLVRAPVDRPGTAAMLSDPALLSLYSNSPYRGTWLVSNLLCIEVSPEVSPEVAKPMTREGVAGISGSSACGAFHRYFDPAGFAFEHFDALGNYRDFIEGVSVDSSGEFSDMKGKSYRFNDIAELGIQLSASCEVARCVARTFATQALERAGLGDAHPDATEFDRIAERFASSKLSALELVRAVATSPSMLR